MVPIGSAWAVFALAGSMMTCDSELFDLLMPIYIHGFAGFSRHSMMRDETGSNVLVEVLPYVFHGVASKYWCWAPSKADVSRVHNAVNPCNPGHCVMSGGFFDLR